MVSDLVAGALADRAAKATRRLAPLVATVTAISCMALLVLPFLSHLGMEIRPLFVGLIFLWAVTSSALRAPLFALVGKRVPAPSVPWQAGLLLLGMGIAAATAPYLNALLRTLDPKVPFVVSSVALLLASLGVMWAERRLGESQRARQAAAPARRSRHLTLLFLIGMLTFTVGFQIPTALSSPRQYLRFAEPADLIYLLPVFWIGFNLMVLPVSLLTKRYGGLSVAGVVALLGSGALYAASHATSLPVLVVAQLATGAGWGAVILSASTAAIELGRSGREGTLVGALFSVLALAAAGRIALTATGAAGDAALVPVLAAIPGAGWLLGGLVLVALAARGGPRK